MIVDNELLAAYAEGKVSPEEREAVRHYLVENPNEMESVLFAMENISYENQNEDENALGIESHRMAQYMDSLEALVDGFESNIQNSSAFNHKSSQALPMTAMAAQDTIDNLCVIRCEGLALKRLGFSVPEDTLLVKSQKEGWLKPGGTALHNIGRLAGSFGLSVSHLYESNITAIRKSLSLGHIVIAVVDANELLGNYSAEKQKDLTFGNTPNHVVIVESVTDETVTVTDSATPQQQDVYPLSQFLDAWDDSSCYLIIISNGEDYEPHPIDLTDVEISDDLIELREAMAENAHEVWAYNRKLEGWAYGAERDDAKKLHPDLVAYNKLPESEKLYDREMAMNTIKLLKKLGWEVSKSNK